MLTPEQIIDWLKLQPNKLEGGFFAGTYLSSLHIPDSILPGFDPVKEERSLCSAIYYLLEPGACSFLHKVRGDMIYHFYAGDPVQMLLLYPPGSPDQHEVCTFSNDISAGAYPMKVIPGDTWL